MKGVRALRATTKRKVGREGHPLARADGDKIATLGVSGRKGGRSLNRSGLTTTLANQVNREASPSGARGGTGGRVGARVGGI